MLGCLRFGVLFLFGLRQKDRHVDQVIISRVGGGRGYRGSKYLIK